MLFRVECHLYGYSPHKVNNTEGASIIPLAEMIRQYHTDETQFDLSSDGMCT